LLKPEDNELLTRVGPETPMGHLLRRFWLPPLLDRASLLLGKDVPFDKGAAALLSGSEGT